MAQSDPLTAMLSPSPAAPPQMHAQMESKLVGMGLKSPSASYASPGPNNYLAPESALESSAQKAKSLRQNRISAPGTLTSTEARWSSQLDQVMERGPSPGLDDASVRSRSPQPDMRPKSTDFAGGPGAHEPHFTAGSRSNTPRLSAGPGSLGLGLPSEVASPALSTGTLAPSGSWASMVNTPLVPMFAGDKADVNAFNSLASLQLAAGNAAAASRVQLEDARKYRRPSNQASTPGSRNVSGISHGSHEDEGRTSPFPGGAAPFGWNAGSRSGADFTSLGLSDPATLNALSMNLANLNLANPLASPNAMQMLAVAQAQQAAQLSQVAQAAQAAQAAQQLGGYGFPGSQLNAPRAGSRAPSGRRSPLPGQKGATSPNPATSTQGGGAGGGAGVAGPDDVDIKILEDVQGWLRVLRLHKYTSNFERSNWREMVNFTDQDLQARGVAAQGARSKFLKVSSESHLCALLTFRSSTMCGQSSTCLTLPGRRSTRRAPPRTTSKGVAVATSISSLR